METANEMAVVRLPSIAELFSDSFEEAFKSEQLNLLLNREPNPKWIKEHPFIAGHKYLPIDKIEFMLRMIFKRYRIEITGQGVSFNGVWVTVRVHYLNPVTGEFDFHDGIGAMQLQTKKGTSPSDLININNGAISMAFPIAKTIAIKDACDHFGALFGCNLNRKDTASYSPDNSTWELTKEFLTELFEMKKDGLSEEEIKNANRIIENNEVASYQKLHTLLKSK